MLIAGAMVFNYVVTVENIPNSLARFMGGYDLAAGGFLLLVNIVLLILGCLLEGSTILLALVWGYITQKTGMAVKTDTKMNHDATCSVDGVIAFRAQVNQWDTALQLSEQALSNRTDLLVWPESAVPKLLRYDKATYEAITDLAKRHHVWMIIGADGGARRRAEVQKC